MKYIFSLIVGFLVMIPNVVLAQSTSYKVLEQKVVANNKAQKYDASISLITDFIEENEDEHFDIYQAYILKSYIYKSLYNYTDTFANLNLALAEGLKTDRKEEVRATILTEKAFAYFDVQNYKESIKIMDVLKKSNYKYIDSGNVSYLIMQEGYINFLNKQYTAAIQKYDEAISILENAAERNLPVIYGKKIELYAVIGDEAMVKKSFDLGYKSALKFKSVKYQIYLLEQLFKYQTELKQWEEAFKSSTKINELEKKYNATENNNKLQILEKEFELKSHDFEMKQNNMFRNFLIVLVIVLLSLFMVGFKLYKANIKSKKIIEFEFDKINNELKLLTSQLDENGFGGVKLSEFNLSARQLEIIGLIRKGNSNKEIGALLFISENTVKYHLKSIYEVLNIGNRSEFFKIIS